MNDLLIYGVAAAGFGAFAFAEAVVYMRACRRSRIIKAADSRLLRRRLDAIVRSR